MKDWNHGGNPYDQAGRFTRSSSRSTGMRRNPAEGGGRTRPSGSHYGCRLLDGTNPFDGLVSRDEVDPEGVVDKLLKDPNKRLMIGVLQQSYDDLFSSDPSVQREAQAWFASDDARSPEELGNGREIGGYNFAYIAEELGFKGWITEARRRIARPSKFASDKTKTCRVCQQAKPETAFHLIGDGGRRAVCAPCLKEKRSAAKVAAQALAAVVEAA